MTARNIGFQVKTYFYNAELKGKRVEKYTQKTIHIYIFICKKKKKDLSHTKRSKENHHKYRIWVFLIDQKREKKRYYTAVNEERKTRKNENDEEGEDEDKGK